MSGFKGNSGCNLKRKRHLPDTWMGSRQKQVLKHVYMVGIERGNYISGFSMIYHIVPDTSMTLDIYNGEYKCNLQEYVHLHHIMQSCCTNGTSLLSSNSIILDDTERM
jgi:hypothetical protein